MRENTLNKLGLVSCCLLVMLSCKARKQLVANNPGITPANSARPFYNAAAKLNPIRAQQLDFNSFSARAHARLNINGNSNDVTLNIRINKDKEIWVSVTYLLGIEVARAKITPDSILVMNKVQSLYIKKPFSFIYTFANKQVNYAMLQALLVGNAAPSLLNDSTKYDARPDSIMLSGNLDDLIYNLVIGNDMKVTQTNLSNQGAGLLLQVSNSAFILSGNYKVPSQIDIASVAKDKKLQVNLRYYKVDFNQQQEYPFNIPDGYSPAN
jgi:hypothetical protein